MQNPVLQARQEAPELEVGVQSGAAVAVAAAAVLGQPKEEESIPVATAVAVVCVASVMGKESGG